MQEKLINLFNRELAKDSINAAAIESEIAAITGRDTSVSKSGDQLNIKISVPWLMAAVARSALDPGKIESALKQNGTACKCVKTAKGVEIALANGQLSKINVILA